MSDRLPAKPGEPAYTFDEVTRGLLALIEWRGSVSRAAAATGMPESRLRAWAFETYPERYIELERTYAEEIERELVAEARENARLAGRATREGILRVQEQIINGVDADCPTCDGQGMIYSEDREDDVECARCKGKGKVKLPLAGRELATSTYQLSKIMGTNVEKVLALTGRPTDGRKSTGDMLSLVRELAAAGVVKVTNQAESEIPDATAIESDT